MIALLQTIVDDFVCWIETGIVLFSNLVITAIGSVIGAVIGLLPSMPTLPSMPAWFTDGYHYVAYWFPVDYAFTLGLSLFTLWLAWLAIALILRWARVIGGNA